MSNLRFSIFSFLLFRGLWRLIRFTTISPGAAPISDFLSGWNASHNSFVLGAGGDSYPVPVVRAGTAGCSCADIPVVEQVIPFLCAGMGFLIPAVVTLGSSIRV
jgi:hypothetical protein